MEQIKDTNRALVLLTKYHKEYIKMAKAISGNNINVRNYAEDYVQEAYLRLSRYDNLYDKVVNSKGKVSKGYMFFCLRSIILNDIKKKSNINFSFLGSQYDFEEKYNWVDEGVDPFIPACSRLEDKMYEVLKREAKWFDYELFKKYLKTGKSFKTLAQESRLGVRTIYLSVKRCKLLIAEHLYEDYADFLNGDYSHIK
jgi:DNA-directed RNA polymerase specialized sigma24 family protein